MLINDYVCKDRELHDYSHVVGDDEMLLVEKCVQCGHVIRFNKSEKGRIDNTRYLWTHEKWFLQKGHPLYEKYYGKRKLVLPKGKEQAMKELQEEYNSTIKEQKKLMRTKYYT